MQSRLAAARVIHSVLSGVSLSEALPPVLSEVQNPREKAFIQALGYETCRWYFELTGILAGLLEKSLKAKDEDIRILLLLGLCQLLHMEVAPHAAVAETVSAVPARKSWAKGLVNAVLRRALREKNLMNYPTHPDWWSRKLQAAWPEEFEVILAANNQHPPLTLRVNLQKISREKYLDKLITAGLPARIVAETTAGIRLEKPVPVTELPEFESGWVCVQDAAAQLAAELLAPVEGERILDACAAPGGKTTHLLERQPQLTELVAIDRKGERLNQVRENLQRLGLSCTLIEADAANTAGWWDGKPFDRILLDAPCSASGVVRRHPDIRLLRREEDIPALAAEQLRLLNALWPLLKSGGMLLYATCSVFPEENTDVLSKFLANCPDAREKIITASWGKACRIGRQILPGLQEMDGFYYAALEKKLTAQEIPMRIEYDIKLDFSDVLIRPKRSVLKSRAEVSLEREFRFRHAKPNWKGVPVIAANMDHTGTFNMATALSEQGLMTALDKFRTPDEWQAFAKKHPDAIQHCFVSTGVSDQDFEKLQQILERVDIPMICLDVANGYTEYFVKYLEKLRNRFPEKIIMAGNVVTGEMVEELILSGTDIVKIGIGPGSVCTTREKTGVGYPQLSAIIECADAAHGLGGHVCADGGCTSPGDVAKAFAAGADFVMLGGMLSGHDECAGDIMEENGSKFMRFYGMSSAEAMERYRGGVAEYRASEGRSVNVPWRGPVKETVKDILGGIRSACTYVGAHRLKEISKRTTFIRVNRQLNEVFTPYAVPHQKKNKQG